MFVKPKRPVRKVFIHCSASDNPAHDNVKTIRSWHLQRGFNDIGYHFYVDKKGQLHYGRDLEITPAAQQGHNMATIAICLGGLEKFTQAQFDRLVALCTEINNSYNDISFHGHKEVSNKLCPNFNYQEVLGLDAKGKMKRGS